MKNRLLGLFQRIFAHEPPLHPVEQRLAKEWIKKRLAANFPELRNRPQALEVAYQELWLEFRPGSGADDPQYELTQPRLGE